MKPITFSILPIIFILISLAVADMPASFYQALNNMDTKNTLCVKNYDAGASVTESYTDFEHLDKVTEVVSRSFNTSNTGNDNSKGNASLEVNINSNFVGKAHVAWQSREVMPDIAGRHAVYGRSTEDLTGVFSIEKFIQLWSNNTLGVVGPNWLPCS
jgi:hypothetical protein